MRLLCKIIFIQQFLHNLYCFQILEHDFQKKFRGALSKKGLKKKQKVKNIPHQHSIKYRLIINLPESLRCLGIDYNTLCAIKRFKQSLYYQKQASQ